MDEKRLRLVFDTMPVLAGSTRPDGALEFVNRAWLDYTGLPLPEALGSGWLATVHPDDVDRVAAGWNAATRSGQAYEDEWRLRRADGSHRWFLVRATALRGPDGAIERWYGTCTDIEDHKHAEQTLRRTEFFLAHAQRLSHCGSWAFRPDFTCEHWSAETYRLFGLSPDQPMPPFDDFMQRVHPDDRARVAQRVQDMVEREEGCDFRFRTLLPDGTVRSIHSCGEPLVEDGAVQLFAGTCMDVTESEEALREIQTLKDVLLSENLKLREQVGQAGIFEEIVGPSEALQSVLRLVARVAPLDSTVLITGETGTGKERVAQAIHRRSPRAARPFVAVNCAAIPAALIASELFGHEKGAFTGATQRHLGRFEMADGGTLFLDEVAELPAETQIALLRVLQERQFERLGGGRTLPVDVRVIAATNRDLKAAVDAGQFRADLFYRLNVFPIEIPPLRARPPDVPALVEYFTGVYAAKTGKRITRVEKQSLELLRSYHWPGNVRELQNVVERAVILSDGNTLRVDAHWLPDAADAPARPFGPLPATLEDRERQLIESALAQCRGRVAGPDGAAARLGVPRSTLESRIRSLRIDKYRYRRMDASGQNNKNPMESPR